MPYYITPPPMNPLSRLLAGIVAVLTLVGAFFFGIFVFAIAIAVGLIAWIAISVRVWWLRRKMEAAGQVPGSRPGFQADSQQGKPDNQRDVIDAEYEVVSREDD